MENPCRLVLGGRAARRGRSGVLLPRLLAACDAGVVGHRPASRGDLAGRARHPRSRAEAPSHADPAAANSIEIRPQARKNIGLAVAKIALQPFTKTISVPGMVVERPGQSVINATAPMTGIITRIYIIEGEAVQPGQKLFDLRMTHEELVQSQAELLQTAEELDVTAREIKRIEKLTAEGALPGKQLLERQYEQQKQQAVLRSKRQALVLHGLTNAQVDTILQERALLQSLTVTAPRATDDGGLSPMGAEFQVQSLKVALGQHVTAGDTLAILADHAVLYIAGKAFERDVPDISRAAERDSPLSAVLETEGGNRWWFPICGCCTWPARWTRKRGRSISSSRCPTNSSRIQRLPAVTALLPGGIALASACSSRSPSRRCRIGSCCRSRRSLRRGSKPTCSRRTAIVSIGSSVHVEFRDEQWAVVANDGSLFPGEPWRSRRSANAVGSQKQGRRRNRPARRAQPLNEGSREENPLPRGEGTAVRRSTSVATCSTPSSSSSLRYRLLTIALALVLTGLRRLRAVPPADRRLSRPQPAARHGDDRSARAWRRKKSKR